MDVGDLVPDFELPDETGTGRSLSGLRSGGPVVVFFYPMAMTKGCTAEACHFRDLDADFAAVGAQRVGISADPVAKQRQFSDLHHLGYPLLSDPSRVVARLFGVRRSLGPIPVKRWTFVISRESRVLAVIKSEVHMDRHADRAIEVLRASRPTAGGLPPAASDSPPGSPPTSP